MRLSGPLTLHTTLTPLPPPSSRPARLTPRHSSHLCKLQRRLRVERLLGSLCGSDGCTTRGERCCCCQRGSVVSLLYILSSVSQQQIHCATPVWSESGQIRADVRCMSLLTISGTPTQRSTHPLSAPHTATRMTNHNLAAHKPHFQSKLSTCKPLFHNLHSRTLHAHNRHSSVNSEPQSHHHSHSVCTVHHQ